MWLFTLSSVMLTFSWGTATVWLLLQPNKQTNTLIIDHHCILLSSSSYHKFHFSSQQIILIYHTWYVSVQSIHSACMYGDTSWINEQKWGMEIANEVWTLPPHSYLITCSPKRLNVIQGVNILIVAKSTPTNKFKHTGS